MPQNSVHRVFSMFVLSLILVSLTDISFSEPVSGIDTKSKSGDAIKQPSETVTKKKDVKNDKTGGWRFLRWGMDQETVMKLMKENNYVKEPNSKDSTLNSTVLDINIDDGKSIKTECLKEFSTFSFEKLETQGKPNPIIIVTLYNNTLVSVYIDGVNRGIKESDKHYLSQSVLINALSKKYNGRVIEKNLINADHTQRVIKFVYASDANNVMFTDVNYYPYSDDYTLISPALKKYEVKCIDDLVNKIDDRF